MANKRQVSDEEQLPANQDAPEEIPEGGADEGEAQPQPAEVPAEEGQAAPQEGGGNEAQPLPAEEPAPQEDGQAASQDEEPLPPGWGYAADGVTLTNWEGKTQEELDAEVEVADKVREVQARLAEKRANIATQVSDEQIKRAQEEREASEQRLQQERDARRARLARANSRQG